MERAPHNPFEPNAPDGDAAQARRTRHGAVLLTVLLMVAVMASVTVAVLDEVRFTVLRTANQTERDQAQWYALSVEELAREVLARSHEMDPRRRTLVQPWSIYQINTPVDGGFIRGRIEDRSLCFNVNSFAADPTTLEDADRGLDWTDPAWTDPDPLSGEAGGGGSGSGAPSAAAGRAGAAAGAGPGSGAVEEVLPLSMRARRDMLRQLLGALELTELEADFLTDSIADFIDQDLRASPRGAEDSVYQARKPAHLTPSGPIADLSELRAVEGMSEPLFRAIEPYLCALPTPDPAPVNINALTPAHWPILAMVFGETIPPYSLQTLIEDRPPLGYDDLEEFWADPLLETYERSPRIRSLFAETSNYFEVDVTVFYYKTDVQMTSLLRQDSDGVVERMRRAFEAPR